MLNRLAAGLRSAAGGCVCLRPPKPARVRWAFAIGLLVGGAVGAVTAAQLHVDVSTEAGALDRMELLGGHLGRWSPSTSGTGTLTQEEKLADLVALTVLFDRTLPALMRRDPARGVVYLRLATDGAAYLDGADAYLALDPALHRQGALAYRAVGDFQRTLWLGRLGGPAGAITSYRRSGHMLRALVASRTGDRALANELSRVGAGLRSLGIEPLLIITPENLRSSEEPAGPSYANPAPVAAPEPAAAPRGCVAPDYDMAAWTLPQRPEKLASEAEATWNELEREFCLVAARVDAARAAVEDLSARLASIGQEPRADLVANASSCELALMDAYHDMERADLEATRGDMTRARNIARKVLQQLGG